MIELWLQARVGDGRRQFELDVGLRSEAGVLGLYGPSGAGKSLTLQGIAGLLPLRDGRVCIGDRVLFDRQLGIDLAPPERRIGYLFQHYALFPHLSVRANIGFGLTRWHRPRLRPQDAARVDALIESFGLQDLAHSRPDSLSGGQRQRVALARALACEPELLLLDEPFAALNPALRRQLREELAALRARVGVPMLIVSHDAEDLLALADEAWQIDEGRVQRRVDLRTASAADLAEAGLRPVP